MRTRREEPTMKKLPETWQETEAYVREYLELGKRTDNMLYHRFYDTRSAGNIIPGQPADFMIGFQNRMLFLEVKFSEKHESLRSCFSGHVKDTQTASAYLWDRAGFCYAFLFYSSVTGTAEAWSGAYCAKCRVEGTPLSKHRAIQGMSIMAVMDLVLSLTSNPRHSFWRS